MRRWMFHYALMLALAALILTTHAAAQGTDGRLPDPINADDLTRYAAILRLSAEQVAATESFLEEYRGEFKLLRDGDIERAIDLSMQEFAARETALLGRIAALDEELFRSIEPILSDDQLEALPYVRLIRGRERYMAISWVRNLVGNALPDLANLVDELDLPEDEREALHGMMPAYQHRIVSGLRGVWELSARLRAAERGKEDPNDAKRLVERVKDLRRYNRSTARTLAQLIADEDRALRLHRRFFRFAYGHAFQFGGTRLLPNYEALLRSDDLDERGREAVLGLRREAIARQTRFLEEMADIIDESGVVTITGDEYRPLEPREMIEQAHELRESFAEALESRFGQLPDAADEPTYGVGMSASWHPGGLRTRSTTLTRAQPRAAPPPAPAPADQFIVPAISSEDVDRYARLLRLEGDGRARAALEEAHRAYLDSYSASIRPMLKELRDLRERAEEAASRAFGGGKGDGSREDVAPIIEEEYELRERVLRAVTQADEGFFISLASDLELEADDERLERVRFERVRDRYNRGRSRWGPFTPDGPNRAAFVHITQLGEHNLAPERQAMIAHLLAAYQKELIPALRERHQRLWARQKAANLLWASPTIDVEEYIRRQQAVRRAHQTVTHLNQRTVEAILEEVGWEGAWQLLDAFQREAYPEAFTDPGAAEPFLAAALELEDLRPHQRERLENVATEHRPAYAAVRQAIIQLCEGYAPDLPGDMMYGETEVLEAERQFTRELERLKFERDNLNRSALRRIRAALDEAQHRRIGAPQ